MCSIEILNLLRLEIIYSSKAFLKHLVCIQHSQMYLVVRKESGYNIYVFSYLNHTSYHGSSKTKHGGLANGSFVFWMRCHLH